MMFNNGADAIQPVTTGRDIGVYYIELSMRMHISKTTQTCFFQSAPPKKSDACSVVTLPLTSLVRSSYRDSTTATLCSPSGHTRPSHHYDASSTLPRDSSLVYGLRPRDHVSAAAIELHWLPVEAHNIIQFKLSILVRPPHRHRQRPDIHHSSSAAGLLTHIPWNCSAFGHKVGLSSSKNA